MTQNQQKIITLESEKTLLRQQLIKLTSDAEAVKLLLTQISALDEQIGVLKVS